MLRFRGNSSRKHKKGSILDCIVFFTFLCHCRYSLGISASQNEKLWLIWQPKKVCSNNWMLLKLTVGANPQAWAGWQRPRAKSSVAELHRQSWHHFAISDYCWEKSDARVGVSVVLVITVTRSLCQEKWTCDNSKLPNPWSSSSLASALLSFTESPLQKWELFVLGSMP